MAIPRLLSLGALSLTPLSLAACGTLIGLEGLEKADCVRACPEPGSLGGTAGAGLGGGGHGGGHGGVLGSASGGAAQTITGGATNNGPANVGTSAGVSSTGGREMHPEGLGGGSGTAGQSPSSGGDAAVALPIRINFQPLGAPVPTGYVADTGLGFAARDDLRFGWSVDHTDYTRDRRVNANQLLDTLCYFHEGATWEIALPNGTYSVLVSTGDASAQSISTLIVEGVVYWLLHPIGPNQFLSNNSIIKVTDGRLTLSQGFATYEHSTAINYIEIGPP